MSDQEQPQTEQPAAAAATAKKPAKKRVSDMDFVRAYAASKSASELASATGLTKASCASRAKKLRDAGVKLEKYQKSSSKKAVDVAALNAVVSGQ